VKTLRSLYMSAVLLLPASLLAFSGLIHLQNGRSEDAAFPVPSYLSLNIPLPKAAYGDAAGALRHANFHDGNSELSMAEAQFHFGIEPQHLLTEIEGGLARAPASAEGWAFYAEALEHLDPPKAAQALGQAFTLAPYDFFWAGKRAQLAVRLWSHLSRDTRTAALRQVQMLWDEPMLHDELLLLLLTPNGDKILTLAYAGEPDTIRAINRFVSARHRLLQAGKP
jgi:hypothetical protein